MDCTAAVVQRSGVTTPRFAAALAWLRAVKSGSDADLAAITALPFTFATTRSKKACEGPIKTPAALTDWLVCARRSEAAWLAELDVAGEPPLAEGGVDRGKLAALMKRIDPKATSWVRTSMSRDGVTYAFRLLVAEDGHVATFLLDVAIETG